MWKRIIWFLLRYVLHVLCDGTYECGDHGRFEYCIDEIPGCVVGCHCHPGYYFDTDTKICEPNSNLIEHHRRAFVPETSQIQNNAMTPNTIFMTIPTTATSKIDGAVDEISKDAEGLGDWLYNQFFKTIENQVINNTNDSNILTRRSGSVQPKKKVKKSKKVKKRKKGKRKGKKSNLKKKLLRITENDSVFDLSSSSNSDSSDSSRESSDSSDESKRYYKNHDDDDEHGHKKIVMIKKKPKQALPNFIFLPNVETPFYPPLGLPPPPIPMPMYPMVPVPPMSPSCHTADSSDSDDETTAASHKSTTVSTTTTISTTVFENNSFEKNSKPPDEPESLRRPNKEKNKGIKDNTSNNLRSSKSPSRQKFLHRLKQKLKNHSSKSFIPPMKQNKKTISKLSKPDSKLEQANFENIQDSYVINDLQLNVNDDSAVPNNVDFKYITELIHGVDHNNNNNKSYNLPPIEYNPFNNIEDEQHLIQQDTVSDYIIPHNIPKSRRINRPNFQYSDDSYYTNLGRQIASLIRGIDTQNKEVNIQLETTNPIPKDDFLLNVNSPRSYWERSVRSPLTILKSNKKKFEYLKRSNELLFDIENKVEIIASTAPTLTLQEIENIVNIMESAKKGMHTKKVTLKDLTPSRKNLNINLWPREENVKNSLRNSVLPNIKNIVDIPIIKSKASTNGTKMNNVPDSLHGFSVVKTNRFAVQRSHYPTAETKSNVRPVSYFTDRSVNYYKIPQYNAYDNEKYQQRLSEQSIRQSLWENEMKPPFLKHRKYFGNSQNTLINSNSKLPYLEPKSRFKNTQTSYFHHQINNIDYIQ